MNCKQCGFENPSGWSFCGRCGTALSPGCPTCGAVLSTGFSFCGACGTRLGAAAPDGPHLERQPAADLLRRLAAYLPPTLNEEWQLEQDAPPTRLVQHSIAHAAHLLNRITNHLPPYLVKSIARRPVAGEVGGEFLRGTLLFADISGFTAMSEQLSRSGREGAEEITAIVNRYFGVMLGIIREYGGQCIRFGGDALLVLFAEPAVDSVAAAIQTALAMQLAMRDFDQTATSQGTFPLRMKVAIQRGRFFAARLGTPQTMNYALFGGDVNATSRTEGMAAAGQVVLDQTTLAALTVPCHTLPVPGQPEYVVVERLHVPPIPMPPLSGFALEGEPTIGHLGRIVDHLDAMAPYLPTGLLPRLNATITSASLEGEHRRVAVLFANIHGLDALVDSTPEGQEQALVAALNSYFVGIVEAAARFGGVINKLDLASHGAKLLAFVGAPLAYEDNAARAVRTALAMQAYVSALPWPPAGLAADAQPALSQTIGLSYGLVFAGYMGAVWRNEYTIMGDVVNLAARLMTVAAPGELAVDNEIRQQVQATFEVEERGSVRLKGKRNPVPVWSVSQERTLPQALAGPEAGAPLIGRAIERAQIQTAIERVSGGRGQIISLTGEAGMGKTRLLVETRAILASQPGPRRSAEGRCLAYTETISYAPWHTIVRQILDIPTALNGEATREQLSRALHALLVPADAETHAPYLAAMLHLPPDPAAPSSRYLDAESLERRVFVAVRAVIESVLRAGPLTLVIEDLHWVDQASIRLLEYLLPLVNHGPLLIVLLYRPERNHGCWRVHEKISRELAYCSTLIEIGQLSPEASTALLNQMLPLTRWPAEIQALVLSRAEGNPLYLEEVMRVLLERRVLMRDEDSWTVNGSVEQIAVPDTLESVIMTRLDRLDPPCRRLSQVAAVVGRSFSVNVLTHILGAGEQFRGCLARLQQHDLVYEQQRQPDLIYEFRHGMIQDVCYQSFLSGTKREYHRSIASYLESQRQETSSDVVPLIAQHAFLGRDWRQALRYYLLAGEEAQQLFANHEALEHFKRALACTAELPVADTAEQRQIIHRAMGELLTLTGRYDEAMVNLESAYTYSRANGDAAGQARACRWMARLHDLRGDSTAAFEWIDRGMADLQGESGPEAVQLLINAGVIRNRQGEYDAAYAAATVALQLAKGMDDPATLGRAHNLIGLIARQRGNTGEAGQSFERGLELYTAAGDLQGQAISHNMLANSLFTRGAWTQADRHYRRSRQLFDQLGNIHNRAVADNNLAGIALNQGRFDEADAFYTAAWQDLERLGGTVHTLGVITMNLGATATRRGDLLRATQYLDQSRSLFGQTTSRDFLSELERHAAAAALQAGDLPTAQAHASLALSLAQELDMRGEEGCARRMLGQLAAASDLAQARALLEQSVSLLAEVDDQYELARSQLALATVLASQGDRAAASAPLAACISTFAGLETAPDLAAATALQARLGPAA